MSIFEEMVNKYRSDILEEAPLDPAAAPAPAAPAPGGEAPMPGAEGGMPAPEEPSPEEVVDELGKKSDIPWSDVAGILAKAMGYDFSSEQLRGIDESLPDDLTLKSFVDSDEDPTIKNKYAPNIDSAAVTLFTTVEDIMSDGGRDDIVPAEDR